MTAFVKEEGGGEAGQPEKVGRDAVTAGTTGCPIISSRTRMAL